MAGVYLPAFLLCSLYWTIRLREWGTDNFEMIVDHSLRVKDQNCICNNSEFEYTKKGLIYRPKLQSVDTNNHKQSVQWAKLNESCEKLNKFNGNCYHTRYLQIRSTRHFPFGFLLCPTLRDYDDDTPFGVRTCVGVNPSLTLDPLSPPHFHCPLIHSFIRSSMRGILSSHQQQTLLHAHKDFIMRPGR